MVLGVMGVQRVVQTRGADMRMHAAHGHQALRLMEESGWWGARAGRVERVC